MEKTTLEVTFGPSAKTESTAKIMTVARKVNCIYVGLRFISHAGARVLSDEESHQIKLLLFYQRESRAEHFKHFKHLKESLNEPGDHLNDIAAFLVIF
jgi:hypothetical protein